MNYRKKYPWINNLPFEDQEECIISLKQTRREHRVNLSAWKSTAEIYADHKLLNVLTTDRSITEESYDLGGGYSLVNVHDPAKCEGRGCSIHHPSDHHMKNWPKVWRSFHGYFERQCPHGIGHPDPDDMAYRKSTGLENSGVHGCDGCCA